MENKNNENKEIKVILLGDCGVGKTNIISRYLYNEFRDVEASTMGSYYATKELKINDKKVVLNIWDTAGQEKYLSVTKMLIQESKIIILCYSITDEDSFQHLNHWLKSVVDIIGNDFILGILANKTDLYENEKVSEDRGRQYATEHEGIFKLTSAKIDKEGIDEYFNILVEKYLSAEGDSLNTSKNTVLKVDELKNKRKCC